MEDTQTEKNSEVLNNFLGTIDPRLIKMLESCEKQDEFIVETAATRSIMFVGKIRCGKTTVLNILKNPIHLAGDLSIFAETVDPNIYTISVKKGEKNYVIQIIDTPGKI
jgi:septin family protein